MRLEGHLGNWATLHEAYNLSKEMLDLNSISELYGPVLYTTGAYIRPLKIIGQDGGEVWVWEVSEFDGDTFYDGDVYHPMKFARSKDELLSPIPTKADTL